MKRFTFNFLLVALWVTYGSLQQTNAQSYYKVHHINQNFDNLGGSVLPTGWATTASTAALFARSGGTNTDNSTLRQSGAGSGNRGMDISFPSPAIVDSVSKIWYVEFDWKCEKVVMGPKNAFGMVFSGSTNNKNLRAANWYVASIFGLYLNGDGFFHYWNQDLMGPYQRDSTSRANNPQYYNRMGPAFQGGSSDGRYARNGVTATHNVDSVAAWNAPTKTNVKFVYDSISKKEVYVYGPRYLASKTYHILAKLNFTTQRVESLTITQNDSTANSQTINDMPFMAPSMIGNDTTVVARQDRVVNDLKFISQFNTRTSTAGSGPNVDYLTMVDNMEIYYLKESVGTTDVTVYYKDKEGNTAKTSRVSPGQQNNEIFRLLDSDKLPFEENGYYYAYDALATKDANIDNSEDGESIIISPTRNTLTAVFKKFTAVAGPLSWTGYEGPFVNQIDGNFKFGSTINLGYQTGKGIEFSDASAPKDVIVDGTIELGASNVTVNTAGYNFSSNGKTTDKFNGTGKFIVNAPALLNMNNATDVQINTLEGVTIKNPNCADSIFAVNNALLKLEPSATLSKKLIGAGQGSTINIELLTSTKGIEYNFGVANTSTINFKLKNAGKADGSSWTSRMSATFPDNVQINVNNEITGKDTIAGFSAIAGSIGKVKIHLGDSVRLVRNYNESDKETVTIGEITGTEKSIIEAGYVSGRSQTYAVGNLNTDATFNGTIRQFLMSNNTFRTGSTLHLNKIGTGKWILNGPLKFIGDITVKAGTLELNGRVDTTVTAITLDSLTTLKTGNIYIGAKNTVINKKATLISQSTIFRGDLQIIGSIQGAVKAYNVGLIDGTVNLYINSFNEGDYEAVTSESDITMIRSAINLSIVKAQAGSIIKIMNAGSGSIAFPEGLVGSFVKVNGEDITTNTEETPGAKFVYFAETGELKCMVDYTDVKAVNANKEIKTVELFNVLGSKVDKYSKGLLIRKITYTDNSTSAEKIFLPK